MQVERALDIFVEAHAEEEDEEEAVAPQRARDSLFIRTRIFFLIKKTALANGKLKIYKYLFLVIRFILIEMRNYFLYEN